MNQGWWFNRWHRAGVFFYYCINWADGRCVMEQTPPTNFIKRALGSWGWALGKHLRELHCPCPFKFAFFQMLCGAVFSSIFFSPEYHFPWAGSDSAKHSMLLIVHQCMHEEGHKHQAAYTGSVMENGGIRAVSSLIYIYSFIKYPKWTFLTLHWAWTPESFQEDLIRYTGAGFDGFAHQFATMSILHGWSKIK